MSEPSVALTTGLLGLALAAGVAGLAELLRPGNWRSRDTWRDPAPRLFRLLLPPARHLARHRRLAAPVRRLLQHRLDRAGIGYAILPDELAALRWLTAALTCGIAALCLPGFDLSPTRAWMTVAGSGLLGYLYPVIWLRDQGQRRQRRLERQFPALLELLGLSVRAGLSFGAALNQSTQHLPPGPLRDECQRLIREIRTGASRREALEGLAARTDLAGIHSFVAAVVQAEDTGAPVSQVLADQARQRRRERFAAAEKKASEAPVRMLLPLVGLLFPVTFLIIGFPIALQFLEGGIG